jgi:hypothetical protein
MLAHTPTGPKDYNVLILRTCLIPYKYYTSRAKDIFTSPLLTKIYIPPWSPTEPVRVSGKNTLLCAKRIFLLNIRLQVALNSLKYM